MKTSQNRYSILKDRCFASDGIEIWRWHGEWLVLSKIAPRYGKLYSLKNSFNSLFNIDGLLRQTYHGVKIKNDPSPMMKEDAITKNKKHSSEAVS